MITNKNRSLLSQTDKLCLAALVGVLISATLIYELTNGQAVQQADKPSVDITWEAPMSQPQLLEAMEINLAPDLYREDIPLDRELQAILREACEEHGVPVSLALGLIEVESRFQSEAENGLCYGLCQLNKRYYPDDLTPAENIQAGMAHLGGLLEQYEDTAAALTAYNAGNDTGLRKYADAVLMAAEKWEED